MYKRTALLAKYDLQAIRAKINKHERTEIRTQDPLVKSQKLYR